MGWGSAAVALVCLMAAMLHVVRIVVVRRDVAAEASHAAMTFGMAAMASPLGDPVPEPVWTGVFVLIAAAWFAALALRSRSAEREAVHHVVGSGAMLFMLAADHAGGHAVGHGAAGQLGAVVPVTAMALTGYFAWHALRCADRCRRTADADRCAEPGAAVVLRPGVLSLRTPRAGAFGNLVAAVAMSSMLLGMV